MGAFTRCMSKTQQTKKPAECGVKTVKEAAHKSTGNAIRTSLLRALQIDRDPKPPAEGSVSRKGQSSARAPRQGEHGGAVTCLVPTRLPRPCRSLKLSTLGQSGNRQPGGRCEQQLACAPQSPFPEKRCHFSYLAAPGEASSQPEAGRRSGSQPEAGRGPGSQPKVGRRPGSQPEAGRRPGSQPEAGCGPVSHTPRPVLRQPQAQGRRAGERRR